MGIDSYDSPDAQALLRAGEERDGRRLDRRELITHAIGAAGFLVAAGLLAALAPSDQPFSVTRAAMLIITYGIVERVKFPVAQGWSSPTMLVFVPMLFMLPTATVPLVAVVAILLRSVPDFVSGRAGVSWLPRLIGDAWYSLGPALVIVLGAGQQFAWSHWPLYAEALLAQVIFDMAATVGRYSIAERIDPRVQLPLLTWIYALDATLAPLGLLIAASAVRRPGLVVLVLPVIGLLALFARERQQRLEQSVALSTAYRGTALLLGDVVDADDPYTGIHSRDVVDLAVAVAAEMRLDPARRSTVEFTALLHDVGKIRIPKQIINKPGALSDDEWELVREHTVIGERMLKQVGGTLASVGRFVRHSHERFDGKGYPDRLRGNAIPIESRIVSACDAFNAITTDRPYRDARSPLVAMAELERCAGTQFDPRVVGALARHLERTNVPAFHGRTGRSRRFNRSARFRRQSAAAPRR